MTASAIVDLQNICNGLSCPPLDQFQHWVTNALQNNVETELTIRIVDEIESQSLNAQYRGIDKPTNILSFPFEAPPQIKLNLLGDLVICASIVTKEALEQGKDEIAHWAHMVVHGTLHLQGYDHLNENDATIMENIEIKVLSKLGFDNPYLLTTKPTDI